MALTARVSAHAEARTSIPAGRGDGLDAILQPVAPGLARMESLMEDVLRGSGRMLRPMARHLIKRPGKRIRGALVLLSAKAGGKARPDDAALLAAAVEMIHTASLVHDDILDGASVRRGLPALHEAWGTRRALLMGDFLLAWNFSRVASKFPVEVLQTLLRAARLTCEGEIEETGMAYRADLTVKRYLETINRKTGALMASACEAGAILGGASPTAVASLRRYGESFGTAFQLVDDALDFSAEAGEMGKPVGHDMVDGIFTMPVLRVRSVMRGRDRKSLMSLLSPRSLSNGGARRLVSLVRRGGGVEYSMGRASAYARKARGHLRGVPAAAAAPLASLAEYVVRRRR